MPLTYIHLMTMLYGIATYYLMYVCFVYSILY